MLFKWCLILVLVPLCEYYECFKKIFNQIIKILTITFSFSKGLDIPKYVMFYLCSKTPGAGCQIYSDKCHDFDLIRHLTNVEIKIL